MKNSAKLLILALAVSMVVACGKETKDEETKKLTAKEQQLSF